MDYDIVAGVGPNKVLVVGAGKTGLAVGALLRSSAARRSRSPTCAPAPSCTRRAQRARRSRHVGARASTCSGSFLDADLIVVSPGVPEHRAAAGRAQEGRAHHRRDRAGGAVHPGADRRRHRHQRQVDGDRAGRRDRASRPGGRPSSAATSARRSSPRSTRRRRRRKGLVVVELSSFQLETVREAASARGGAS